MWLLVCSFMFASAEWSLPTPDFGEYLKLETINSFLSNISNSSLVSTKVIGNITSIKISDPKFYYEKPVIMSIGSLHGGFPQASYSVMSFIVQALNLPTNLNLTDLVFIPVANPAAYKASQGLNEVENFTAIWTDLTGGAWNCTNNSYAGYDPDKCFSRNYVIGKDKCAADGYSGTRPFESTLSIDLKVLIEYYDPDLVFIFDNTGNIILYPFAGSSSKTDARQEMYYDLIGGNIDSVQRAFDVAPKSGSLLDYFASQQTLAFEIRGKDIVMNNTQEYLEQLLWYQQFIANAMYSVIVIIYPGNLTSNYDECQTDCGNFTYTETYDFQISSVSYSNYTFDLIFTPGTTNNSISFKSIDVYYMLLNSSNVSAPVNVSCIAFNSSGNGLLEAGPSYLCQKITIPGFSVYSFKVVYQSLGVDGLNANFTALLRPSSESYNFYPLMFIEHGYGEDESSSMSDSTRGSILGGALAIILIIALLIAASILYCVDKNHKYIPPGTP